MRRMAFLSIGPFVALIAFFAGFYCAIHLRRGERQIQVDFIPSANVQTEVNFKELPAQEKAEFSHLVQNAVARAAKKQFDDLTSHLVDESEKKLVTSIFSESPDPFGASDEEGAACCLLSITVLMPNSKGCGNCSYEFGEKCKLRYQRSPYAAEEIIAIVSTTGMRGGKITSSQRTMRYSGGQWNTLQ